MKRAASSHPGLAFPKGRTRKAEKRDGKAAQSARVQLVHEDVWDRGLVCQGCGGTETETDRRCPVPGHQMDEAYSRAHTRGMTPERRFDTRWCLRACANCHLVHTENVGQWWFQSLVDGANGPVALVADRPDGWFSAAEVWAYADERRAR